MEWLVSRNKYIFEKSRFPRGIICLTKAMTCNYNIYLRYLDSVVYKILLKNFDVRIKFVHQGLNCFPCCPEVVKINELSFVFKSLEKKNFGACRSSDRCLLECSSDYWLNHVGATIAQASA